MPIVLAQRSGNVVLLEEVYCRTKGQTVLNRGPFFSSGGFIREAAGEFDFACGEIALQFIKEFAHVARPVVGRKPRKHVGRQGCDAGRIAGLNLALKEMRD